MRGVVIAGAAALSLAGGSTALAAPGSRDGAFGPAAGVLAEPGAGAAGGALAALPDGRLLLAGGLRDSAGEFAFLTRLDAGGRVDPGFGVRRSRFGAGGVPPQRTGAVVAAAHGAIYTGGVAGSTWVATRLLPDGAPDPRFGAGGTALLEVGGTGTPGPVAAGLLPDGRLVLAGSVPTGAGGEQIAVARFDAIGQRDPSFGRNGLAVVQLGSGSRRGAARSAAAGMVLLPDARVLLAGRASGPDGMDRAVLARLTAAGGLDAGFASGGRVIAQLGRASLAGAAESAFAALTPLPGGGLLAAGRGTDVAGGTALLAARFAADGRPATRFGVKGSLLVQADTPRARPVSVARTAGVAADGSMLLTGAATEGALAIRLAPGGAVDCTYGAAGRVIAFGGPVPGAARGRWEPRAHGAIAAVVGQDGAVTLTGRHPAGALLGRLSGGTGTAVGGDPVTRTLGVRPAGRGTAVLYGYVDPRCATVRLRFVVRDAATGKRLRPSLTTIRGRLGPQVVCTRVRGLRPGRRYTAALAGARPITFRARARAPQRAARQDGC